MNQFQETIKFLNQLGIEYKIFTDPQFLFDHEKHKQAFAISIGPLDLNFSEEGKFIGLNSEATKSWKKPNSR